MNVLPDANDTASSVCDGSSGQLHGAIGLYRSRCTSCMICARECPTWCISLETHPEATADPVSGRGRGRSRNVLDEFRIDYGLCMYCGICIDECPFGALTWLDDHISHSGAIQQSRNLIATISQLSIVENDGAEGASHDV